MNEETGDAYPEENEYAAPKQQSSTLKVLVIGCLVLVLLMLLGFGGCVWYATGPGLQAAIDTELVPMLDGLEQQTKDAPNAAEISKQVEAVKTLGEEGKLKFWSVVALTSLDNLSRGGVDDDEAVVLEKALNRVVDNGGEISIEELTDIMQQAQ